MRQLRVAAAVLLTFTSSCVIVDPSCHDGDGATILISPSVIFISVGESRTPRASWCRDGRFDDGSPDWSLAQAADGNVIALDGDTGRITGKRPGTAMVIARHAGLEGASVQVTVR